MKRNSKKNPLKSIVARDYSQQKWNLASKPPPSSKKENNLGVFQRDSLYLDVVFKKVHVRITLLKCHMSFSFVNIHCMKSIVQFLETGVEYLHSKYREQ